MNHVSQAELLSLPEHHLPVPQWSNATSAEAVHQIRLIWTPRGCGVYHHALSRSTRSGWPASFGRRQQTSQVVESWCGSRWANRASEAFRSSAVHRRNTEREREARTLTPSQAASPGPPLQLRPSKGLHEVSRQDLEGTYLVCVLWPRSLYLSALHRRAKLASQAPAGF